jgi:hypothetical protein
MRIEIKSTEINEFSGTSKTGNPYHIRKQTGYAFLPSEAYPVKIEINLPENRSPYPAGMYHAELEKAIYVKNNSLALGRLELNPVAAQKAS